MRYLSPLRWIRLSSEVLNRVGTESGGVRTEKSARRYTEAKRGLDRSSRGKKHGKS